MRALGLVLLLVLVAPDALACIWDSDTIEKEEAKAPELAKVILEEPAPVDPKPLRERVERLLAEPHADDPKWLNDLAGAYLRLGQPQDAVALLEPAVKKTPGDYGLHANLGTAYHLLGRYKDAAREIARDLKIDPEAHFGLERYHLMLLRYLNQSTK